MGEGMSNSQGMALIFMILFGALIAGAMLAMGSLLGPRKPNPAKAQPFECGKEPFQLPGAPTSVRFYVIGMLFVLFDVEIVFLFPWAIVFHKFVNRQGWGLFMLVEMLVFLAVLGAAYLYLWRRGALEWE